MGYPAAYRRTAVARPDGQGGSQPLPRPRPRPRPRPKPDNDNNPLPKPRPKGDNDNYPFPRPRKNKRDDQGLKRLRRFSRGLGGLAGFAAGVIWELDWIFQTNLLRVPSNWFMETKCAGTRMDAFRDSTSTCVLSSAYNFPVPYTIQPSQTRFDIAQWNAEDPPSPAGYQRWYYTTHSKWRRSAANTEGVPYLIPYMYPDPWQDPFFRPWEFPPPLPYVQIPNKPTYREWPQEREVGPRPRPYDRPEDRPVSPDTRVEYEPPRRPPGPKEKERKFRLTINGTVIGDIVSAVGEGVEYVEILYDALPEHIRKAFERSFRGKVTPQKKFEAIWENFDKINMGEVVEGLIENYAEDKFWGTVGQYMADASGKFNKLGGFQLGPAM